MEPGACQNARPERGTVASLRQLSTRRQGGSREVVSEAAALLAESWLRQPVFSCTTQ